MEHTERDVLLFYEMMRVCHDLRLWICSHNAVYYEAGRHESEMLVSLFDLDSSRSDLLEFGLTHRHPLFLTNRFGLSWVAVFEKTESELERVYMIGPFLTEDVDQRRNEALFRQLKISALLQSGYTSALQSLPIISPMSMMEYTCMLHYCVTREKIAMSDIHFHASVALQKKSENAARSHGTWAYEQAVLKMISDGNLNYRQQMSRLVNAGQIGQLSNGEPQRQYKNAVIIFTSLCCRAAVSGGLSPETAYTLADRYIQSVESAATMAELGEINMRMQEDYVQRVHRSHLSTLSPEMKELCDWIVMHVTENPSLEELAQKTGYSKYYLTQKFKKETGMTLTEYIRRQKIEQAKVLLCDHRETVQGVADKLGFCTRSYFAECFREVTGVAPLEWRRGTANEKEA